MKQKSTINVEMANEKPYKLDPNVEAALGYLPGIGLANLIMEKNDKFVRFHAYQSIFFWITAFALYSMADSLTLLLVGIFLLPIVKGGIVLLWLFLTWKAYNEDFYELPLLGRLSKEQAEK